MAKFNYAQAIADGHSPESIKQFLTEHKNSAYEKPEKSDTFFGAISKNFRNFAKNLTNPSGELEIENDDPVNKIDQNLLKKVPNFNYQKALQEGHTPEAINEFLEENQPQRSLLEKGGRIGSQLALGAAENALLPYEIGVAPLASKDAQNIAYRETLSEDLENLMNKKAAGQWDESDQKQYENISKQLQDARESEKFAKTANLGVRDIAENITGVDLHPEDTLEKAANWIGFIKDPKKLSGLFKTGIKPIQLMKAIAPTGTEALRGLGAGAALQLAEDGEYGPIGTLGAVIAGDLMGHGAGETLKYGKNLITNPKQTLASTIAKFTPQKKLSVQKEIIEDFNKAGIQADLGTITDSNLIKLTQSRLAQSGLVGKELEELMKKTTDQIEHEYKAIANNLGEMKYASTYEAGLAAKEGMKTIREAELSASRRLYKEANDVLKEGAKVQTSKLRSSIQSLEKELKPGVLKSGEQAKVLDVIKELKKDLVNTSGESLGSVKNLMNNKIALNDIINYEVQGGAKQLLKNIVGELDRAIISHGKENPFFTKSYVNANKKFSDYAKTFRNPEMNSLLKDVDPARLMNKMNTVHGIKRIENILKKSAEGQEIFNGLKRSKFDQTIGNNLIDSTTQQAKLGTFSKLLEKGKNREIINEILGKESFKRLERLQKNSGRLAEAVQKYYNASKSASTAIDAAIIVQGMNSIVNILNGNAWPLMKLAGGVMGARKLNALLSNPEFLKLTEQAIINAEKASKQQIIHSFEQLRPFFQSIQQQQNQNTSKD